MARRRVGDIDPHQTATWGCAIAQTGEEIRLESDSVEIDNMRYVRAPRTKASFIGPLL